MVLVRLLHQSRLAMACTTARTLVIACTTRPTADLFPTVAAGRPTAAIWFATFGTNTPTPPKLAASRILSTRRVEKTQQQTDTARALVQALAGARCPGVR